MNSHFNFDHEDSADKRKMYIHMYDGDNYLMGTITLREWFDGLAGRRHWPSVGSFHASMSANAAPRYIWREKISGRS